MQLAYAKAQDIPGPGINNMVDAEQTLAMLRAAAEECYEAIMLLPNRKTWSTLGTKATSLQTARNSGILEEIVDAHLFLIAAICRLGYSKEEFAEAIAKKIARNKQRADHLIAKNVCN